MSQTELLILGATGASGGHVLNLARATGFKIHLLLRDPSKLAEKSADIKIIEGDARNPEALAQAMPKDGLVISCLGVGPKGPRAFYSHTAKAIVTAAQAESPRQIVVLSTLGTGSTASRRTPMLSGIFRLMGAHWILDDRAREEEIYQQSGLPITVLQSCLLSNGKAKGQAELHDPADVPGLGFMGPMISRVDVAKHLLTVVQADPPVAGTRCLLP